MLVRCEVRGDTKRVTSDTWGSSLPPRRAGRSAPYLLGKGAGCWSASLPHTPCARHPRTPPPCSLLTCSPPVRPAGSSQWVIERRLALPTAPPRVTSACRQPRLLLPPGSGRGSSLARPAPPPQVPPARLPARHGRRTTWRQAHGRRALRWRRRRRRRRARRLATRSPRGSCGGVCVHVVGICKAVAHVFPPVARAE